MTNEPSMKLFESSSDGMCERDRKNNKQVNIWWTAWAFAFITAILVLGPGESDESQIAIWQWVLVVLPLAVGVFAVRAYLRFLHEADEMIRQIHLGALAMGCASGLIVGTGFGLFAQVLSHIEDAGAFIWMSIVMGYSFGMMRASRKLDV